MRGGNVLKSRSSIFINLAAAGAVVGSAALTSACAEGLPKEVATVTHEAPATTTSPAFKPIVGTVAHTENAAGAKEGTWPYKGPFDTAADREKAGPVVADGATVQVLCSEGDGRDVPLRQQSPNLNLDSSNDWLQLQVPEGDPAQWLLDVYVDTQQKPPEC